MSTAELLREARALIERGWTQGTMARNRWSHWVAASSPGACRFCPVGALARVSAGDTVAYLAASEVLWRAVPEGHIVWWNDAPGRKKTEVLSLFDRAIELAEAEQ